MTLKRCTKCKQERTPEEFYRNARRPDGRQDQCSKCSREYHQSYYAKNREKCIRAVQRSKAKKPDKYREFERRADQRYRLGKLGLSIEDYEVMLANQNGQCAICNKTPDIALCVDHDHSTGLVRGLLCSGCNVGLGYFADDPVRLKGALRYLALATT